jgi:UDPglucose 6-dehydrogenase
MNVTISGTGYVGLVTGACFAEVGNHVVCVDVDQMKIDLLNQGEVPIFEPGLAEVVARGLRSGSLAFTTDAVAGIDHGDIVVIAVGTPPNLDGSPDLHFVHDVARTVGCHMTRPTIVVTKSTVPVGTADAVRAIIGEELATRGLELDFDVVSNPEFLKEGAAVDDFMRPDRIIIGTEDPHSLQVLQELYAPFNRHHRRIIAMDVRSAELTKYAANAMLATKISFMNELANIAERLDADIENVRVGIGSDSRIGYDFIYAGCGYGGSCFPKDVQALEHAAAAMAYNAPLLRAVDAVNQHQKHVLAEKVLAHFGGDVRGLSFALWGLAFKPNTDDMREAPSRTILEDLWAEGAMFRAYDPGAMAEARRIFGDRPDLVLCESMEEAASGADALIIATEWRPFRSPDFVGLKAALTHPVIFDGRNLYDPLRLSREGFTYYGIGLGTRDRRAKSGVNSSSEVAFAGRADLR